MNKIKYLLILVILWGYGCNDLEIKEGPQFEKAVAVLYPINDSGVSGIVYFNYKAGILEIIADVKGLKRGKYGFHIHEYGDLSSEDASSTGIIFNPSNVDDKKKSTNESKVGNMGNLFAMNDSLAQKNKEIFLLPLSGKNSIIGRSIVVHAKEDDYKSIPCGNAGGILAAGIIGIALE